MEFLENQSLVPYTTMHLGGKAKYLCIINNKDELLEAVKFANDKSLRIITLGDGSNIIFKDAGFDGLIIINRLKGIELKDNLLIAAAGENWDEIVKLSVDHQLAGIEALSLIPGTVGGAPVNNIGAYGQEIKDTLVSVEVFDTHKQEFITLSNKDCQFAYRNSVFKSTEHGRYIICSVSLKLNDATNYQAPTYASLKSEYIRLGIENPTPEDTRNAVIHIRQSKLPDPKLIANTGSFFKNPIISNRQRDDLLQNYPELIYFDYNGQTKVAAGWLIDNAGLKGFELDGIKVYEKQALVLVNMGTRSFQSLQNMIEHIQNIVHDKYGITLEIEPEIK